MDLFWALLVKLIPLYAIILLGYIAGRVLNVQKESISALLMYIVYPVVVFGGVATTDISLATLSLPLLLFVISCALCLLFYRLSGALWTDTTRNLLAFGAGTANAGYFGLAVALVLFDAKVVGLYVLAILGMTFYENTLGFYITARGRHTAADSLKKIARLPPLYAFVLGLIVNAWHVTLPAVFFETAANFQATVTVLGMLLIGLGLAGMKDFRFDMKFVGVSFLAKFLAWPVSVGAIVLLDATWLHFYGRTVDQVLLLVAVMPLAVNMAVFATELDTQPDKASFAILLSTVFALFYIPLFAVLFLR